MAFVGKVREALERDCETIFKLRAAKSKIETELSAAEKRVKDAFRKAKILDDVIGDFLVHIKITPPALIVDTEKLKEAKLFESYSKLRAGSESLSITKNSNKDE